MEMSFGWFFILMLSTAVDSASKPCAARQIEGQSTVCVCNATYCDNVIRIEPTKGSYVTYTSTKEGLRLEPATGVLRSKSDVDGAIEMTIDTNERFQTMQGFGGAVTDAAAINWSKLPKSMQNDLIESYYGSDGLQYNIVRVPIGGSDFSTHAYAYNESPYNDTNLSNYTLSQEDYTYKIPMIKAIMDVAANPVYVIGATWSPPIWMKTNMAYSGISRLIKEFYSTYALYHLKFIRKYHENGIPVWAITTTNEPFNGVVPLATFNSLGWEKDSMAKWITENLGPTIRNSEFNNTKILINDDQRFMIPIFVEPMLKKHPSVLQYIDGLAVHFYGNIFTPATVLTTFAEKYPDKFLIATEACEGSFPWEAENVLFGSWSRAETYVTNILEVRSEAITCVFNPHNLQLCKTLGNEIFNEDLNHMVTSWVDWNLCLNPEGGPNWVENYVDSPIIVMNSSEFVKQPMFYAMGHFTKFVIRDSIRINTVIDNLLNKIEHVAFITPRDTIVAVLYNKGSRKTVKVSVGNQSLSFTMERKEIKTIELRI